MQGFAWKCTKSKILSLVEENPKLIKLYCLFLWHILWMWGAVNCWQGIMHSVDVGSCELQAGHNALCGCGELWTTGRASCNVLEWGALNCWQSITNCVGAGGSELLVGHHALYFGVGSCELLAEHHELCWSGRQWTAGRASCTIFWSRELWTVGRASCPGCELEYRAVNCQLCIMHCVRVGVGSS